MLSVLNRTPAAQQPALLEVAALRSSRARGRRTGVVAVRHLVPHGEDPREEREAHVGDGRQEGQGERCLRCGLQGRNSIELDIIWN